MRIALIGSTGHWAMCIDGLHPERDQLVAVAPGSHGEDMEHVLPYAKQHHQTPTLCDDAFAMLETHKPEVVIIAPWFCDHARYVIEALQRGMHVFCEKPLALDFDDLKAIRTVKQAHAELHLAAMLDARYNPPFRAAYNAIRAGRIGDPIMISAQKSYKLGTRQPFFTERNTYGGTIPWVGSHAIDWVRWLSGKEFCTVRARQTMQANGDHGSLESAASCLFYMEDDVMATVTIDYLRPQGAKTHGDDRVRVVGSEGVVEVLHDSARLITAQEDIVLPLETIPPMFSDFLSAVRGESTFAISAEDSMILTEVVLATRDSADRDETIYFNKFST